ncbi:hypothetical protein [Chenggangzhangella methanolivorans]|uniref:Uncharacterized protein n=1 Tax=Chenggangzhangella methanolivorans TaxID=1437009 RepID=A0A9E6ULC7_9HYPH|nr:hypothetical protein [Chenggangzhangella methanolivorans]QZO00392.1 hypothetical protein K6K41_01065 [Chenggangzhangella methanolivorans]
MELANTAAADAEREAGSYAAAAFSLSLGGPASIARSEPIEPRPLREALVAHSAFPHVRIADTYARLRAIGALRHRQYVAGQGKPYASAVRDAGTLLELADFSSVNLYAVDRDGLTAAMRVGPLVGSNHPKARHFQSIAEDLNVSARRTLICTRLVRDPRHSGRHAVDLVSFVRVRTVEAGWRYCLMQTSEALVRFFERQGFTSTGRWSQDESAGRLQTMLLDTHDLPVRPKAARTGDIHIQGAA